MIEEGILVQESVRYDFPLISTEGGVLWSGAQIRIIAR